MENEVTNSCLSVEKTDGKHYRFVKNAKVVNGPL
jgi:hypothetical protein